MRTICLYFEIHQIIHLKRYRFFDIGSDHYYYDDYANDTLSNGEKRGTFRSYSVLVDTHDITLRNLTIENASGDSKTHGQAIALYSCRPGNGSQSDGMSEKRSEAWRCGRL